MKKIALAAAVLAAFTSQAHADVYNRTTTSSSSYSAQTTSDYNSPLTGAYFGAYGGYGWTDLDSSVGTADVNGGDYGLFAGMKLDQWLQNNIGINGALEVFYGWSGADDTVAGIDVEKDHEWGINFRPGLSFLSMNGAINPYGIIGYRRTNFEASAGAIAGDEDYNGLDLGIGTEVMSWNNVGLRLDYTHTFYEEKNGIDPDEDNLRVGLAYHF